MVGGSGWWWWCGRCGVWQGHAQVVWECMWVVLRVLWHVRASWVRGEALDSAVMDVGP